MNLELKMKLDVFGVTLADDAYTKKYSLMREADEACLDGDKARCMDAISRLYDLFDEDFDIA